MDAAKIKLPEIRVLRVLHLSKLILGDERGS